MKLLSLADALEAFLEQPSAARFVGLRELVVAGPDYHPSIETLCELTGMLADQPEELLRRVDALGPAWSICPRIHFLAGCAAESLGDWEEVELRRFLATTCVDGILSTGEGTRRRPWLATYPSDAQDCLMRHGLSIQSQRLVEGHDVLFDVITATSGESFWFDVSDLVGAGVEPSLAVAESRK